MMSDDGFDYFNDYDDYDYYHDDDDDDDDDDMDLESYYDDLGEHCIYMSGSIDDMDDTDYINPIHKTSPSSNPDENDRKAIYRELSIQDPSELLKNPCSLIDICSLKVALTFPFAHLENRTPPVPDNIQLKVIKHSFPQSMEKIKRYCVLNNGSSTEFERAIRIVKSVKDMKQIGFHLSADIESRGGYRDMWYGPPGKKSPNFYVTVKFDRGKITETHCPCETTTSWCYHVIAVCLARIFKCDECVFKPPLSDSLNNLKSYAELRTFTQYLIAEFCDGRIIESAQNVLDRMLTPRNDENDAINQIWGAPDPTAGPGVDEPSQWLICEEGLKARCTNLIRNTDVTEGCWGVNIAELGPSSSIMEWFRSFQLEKPVVADYFCEFADVAGSGNSSFSYNYYRHSYSREKSQEIAKFLTTCEEIVKDDFSYSLKAVKTFTLQLISVIEERNQREYYRYDNKVFESNSHLGCIPRPQQCWLFRDQLARLWRLLLLNPTITEKQRDDIVTTLEDLDKKLPTSTTTTSVVARGNNVKFKKEYLKWDSQKHVQNLKQFSWEKLELGEGPFKNNKLAEVTIEYCVVMETQKTTPHHVAVEELRHRFSYPVSLRCGSFSSSVTVFCYMVEALIVYGKLEQAVHLAMALGLAIVRYYNLWLEGEVRVAVQNTICVDWDEEDEIKETAPVNSGKRAKSKRRCSKKRGRKGPTKENEATDKEENKRVVFHEETGVIPVTSLAYLLNVLDENVDLVAEMLKLVKVQHRGIGDDDMEDCDDVTGGDAHSLIFCLGVVGLVMPKVQAPSLQLQVEWFNWEAYITEKMAKRTATNYDVAFLRKMTYRLTSMSGDAGNFIPPYTAVMTLFTHLYKPSSNGKVSEECIDALTAALKTIEMVPAQSAGRSFQKRMFFETCRRHWVKLVETVIYSVSNRADHLKQVLHSVFVSTSMIGSSNEKLSTTSRTQGAKKGSFNDQKTTLIQYMIPEKVVAALYLSHSLVERADKIRLNEPANTPTKPITTGSLGHLSPVKSERKTYETLVVHGRKMLVKELPMCEQRRQLYESAIKVGTFAYAVKNNAFHRLKLESCSVEYNFPEFLQRNLRWLCRLSNKIDVKAFELILERHQKSSKLVKCFNDDEVIRLCTQMLESEQRNEDRVWLMVKQVLLMLMQDENHKKINEILELCRTVEKDRSKPAKRALLFPAICQEILNSVPKTSLAKNSKVDYLARAMKLMQTLFKDSELDDNQDNLSGLKELFADSSVSSGNKPGTSTEKSTQTPLDRNLQLSFDLCLEAVKYLDENDKVRGYESRRRCENMCEVVTFVAQKAFKKESKSSVVAPTNGRDNVPDYEEVYISRFVEALCNIVKDCLLLTDFFFEISSRLLVIPQHGSFGRDKVLFSDDCKVAVLCKSCPSLLVLLKRCIAGLSEATHGDTMKAYLKETTQESKSYLKTRAKHSKFYCGSSLVSVLDVLKRLMNISEDEEDFESLSYKIAAKHPVTKAALEELNSKGPNSSPRDFEDGMIPEELLSSLLLRRMFSPALAGFDYDSEDWRY